MKRFSFLLLVTSTLVWSGVNAQEPNIVEKPQVFPSTPQSQMFEKYLNHAITEYNGLPEISIPLYTIEIKGMKIPVNLSYHAGGIKYKSYDGELGAGWSISAGGYRVSRTIYGKPDEMFPLYDPNVAFGSPSLEHSGYLASIGLDYADAMEIMAINNNDMTMRDGEYDQFNYMLPSTNGQFAISDRTNKTVALANQNQDKILLDPGSTALTMDNVKIVDNAGFEYYAGGFQGSNQLIERSRVNPDYKTAWPVSKIISPYNETVDFTYNKFGVNMSNETYYTYKVIDAMSYNVVDGDPPLMLTNRQLPDNEEQLRYLEDMYFIEKIQTEKEKVEFQRLPNSNVMSGILVTNLLNNEQLQIGFTYNEVEGHRLLTEMSVNGKSYSFDYYDPPADMSDAFPDQWGFYKYPFTGNEYWGLYLHQEFKEHYFSETETSPGNTRSWVQMKDRLNYILPCFTDRESNENPHYFSLKTITFPTKGTTTYEYEPNQYSKATASDPSGPTIKGGGQRVKKIISRASPDQPAITTLFKYGINENGNGKVDVDYLNNIKYNFFSDTWFYDLTTNFHLTEGYWFYTLQKIHTYSPKAMGGDIDLEPPVEYEQVTTYQYDETHDKYLGKIVSTYDVPSKYGLSTMYHPSGYPADNYLYNDAPARYVSYYGIGVHPTLKKKEFYSEGSSLPIRKEDYTYDMIGTTSFMGIKVKQKLFFDTYPVSAIGDLFYPVVSSLTDGYFDYGAVTVQFTAYRPLTKTVTEYDGSTPMIRTESYEYNTKGLVSKKTEGTSLNTNLVTEYSYPQASDGGVYALMEDKNMISPVIKTVIKNNGIETRRIHTNYTNTTAITTGLILPESVETSFTGAANLRTELSYNKYDSKGNILQLTGADGIINSFIWGYAQKNPIASATGAAVTDIFHTSFEDLEGNSSAGDGMAGLKSRVGGYSRALTGLSNGTYTLSYWQKSGSSWTLQNNEITVSTGSYTISLSGQVDEIKFYPKNSQMVTATFNPHKGVTSMADPNNRFTFYEYDAFGRLSLIRDQDKNILKKICYNYAGQPENCGIDVTPKWQSTGETRCQPCPSNSAYYTGNVEHREKDVNSYSVTYNTFRWVSDGPGGSCTVSPPDWQNTSTPVRCRTIDGLNTGEREQEQVDANPCTSQGARWAIVDVNCTACSRPEAWELIPGQTRCAVDANGDNTGHQEQLARNTTECSPTYNQTKWVDTGLDCATCPRPAGWQSTGNYRCVKDGSNNNTGEQEREEKDLESCSATYNQTRWVSNGTNCTTCPKPANWQATGTTRCGKNTGNTNTGYEEIEERDLEPCSATYNQTRWVQGNYNTTSCPLTLPCVPLSCKGAGRKCVNGTCETGVKVYTSSYYDSSTHQTVCVYHYEFSDNSWSIDYYEYHSGGGVFCLVG